MIFQKLARIFLPKSSFYLECNMSLTLCQSDEFWSFILKKAKLPEAEKQREDRNENTKGL